MEGVTLSVAVAATVLVFLLPLRWGFLVYLATLLYYPDYLRIIQSGLTISAGRIVVVALLARCLFDEQLRRNFRWSLLDTLVVLADAIYIIVLLLNSGDALASLKFKSGDLMHTTLAYFATRFIIYDAKQLILFLKGAIILLIPLTLLGVYESYTCSSPYDGLLKYQFYAERGIGSQTLAKSVRGHGGEARFRLFRAQGPHGHPILFGLTFVTFLPLVWKVLRHSDWHRFRTAASGALVIGALSSLSSGPFIGLLMVFGVFAFFRLEGLKRNAKLLLMLIIVMCIGLELYTDRPHFYHVFASKLAFDPATAYARTRLFEVAIEHLPEYWLTGYGRRDPGWGPEITGMNYTDICVHYIALATTYGLAGLLAYLSTVTAAVIGLWKCQKRAENDRFRSIMYGLLGSFAAMLGAHLAVSSFGVLLSLYSILFGLAGSMICLKFARPRHSEEQIYHIPQVAQLSRKKRIAEI